MAPPKVPMGEVMKWIRSNPATASLLVMLLVCSTVPVVIWQLETGVKDANINGLGDAWWYGIVTMLTVGYGDKYAVTPAGRGCASFMMIVGVVGMSIVTARISSIFLEKALRDRRGLVDSENLKDHFVICGWKSEMSQLIHNIINASGVSPERVVLVNSADDAVLETLHQDPVLKKTKWVRGDFFNIETLRRAAPERALKVLILADATPRADGSIPTRTEADARTVMTAMTLSNIAKGTSVAAEILDSQMDQYLKLAHVHEIIYSRDYSRLLLALASSGTGVTNVLHDLLDPASAHMLTTTEIPADAAGQTYAKLREGFRLTNPGLSLLGVLENSGNGQHAKEMALKKAQQTPNIQKLVENLMNVKHLRFNQPVFSPADDYVVPEGCRAIIIRPRTNHATGA